MSELVIRDVGETLITLLRTELAGLVNAAEIALVSPVKAIPQQIRLTVFLYSLTPTAELRNAPPIREASDQERRPPLPLDLYYLITAFGTDAQQDPTLRTLDAHHLLGAAMRVLYDNGTISGGLLQGNIHPDTELRLSLQPITVEDLTPIWSVFPDSVFQPSVSYLVTPARIDSRTQIARQRVTTRQTDVDPIVTHPVGTS